MKTLDTWLSEYSESHQNHTNKLIHYLCVPAIYMTVIGLLWSIPFPIETAHPLVNWSLVLLVPACLFYLRLSFVLGLGMILFSAICLGFVWWWQVAMPVSVLVMSLVVFVVAWILQFIGHKIEGKKPSFFKDVQFLLIGPAWIFCHLFPVSVPVTEPVKK